MSNPTESPLSAAVADALSGMADPNTGAIYNTIGASTYYTAAYQKEAIWNRAMALSNDLRVVKDGDSTFGVRGGMCRFGNQTLNFAGASCQSLTANSVNYIYMAESGTLAVSTTGFPASINCVSLAVISVPASGIYSISNITDYRGAAAFSAVVGTEAVTAGSGSPNILTAYETKKVITNEGADMERPLSSLNHASPACLSSDVHGPPRNKDTGTDAMGCFDDESL
jgi:hypothetical protein